MGEPGSGGDDLIGSNGMVAGTETELLDYVGSGIIYGIYRLDIHFVDF